MCVIRTTYHVPRNPGRLNHEYHEGVPDKWDADCSSIKQIYKEHILTDAYIVDSFTGIH